MIDADEFEPERPRLTADRCDVCHGRLPEEERRGPQRERHSGQCVKAKKRERTRWGREG